MTELNWPNGLVPRIITMQLINQTRSMNQSMSGLQQVNSSLAQRWRLSLDFNTLTRPEVLSFRSMMAALEGRANSIRVPVWDKRLWPELLNTIVFHSDGSTFDDGSGYSMNGTVEGVNGVERSSTVSADIGFGPEFVVAGHYIQIDDDVYIITSTNFSNNEISVQPRLRRNYVNATLNFAPKLHCRLSGDEVGDMPLEFGLRGSPSVEFVEVL